MQNYHLHYKYVCRYLLILKYVNINSYLIPTFTKINLFFNIYNTTNQHARCGFNYIYLFKYFFGLSGYFCKYYTRFHLNVWYYSFCIQITVKALIRFYLINILTQIFFKLKTEFSFYIAKNICIFVIKDMTLFLETNSSPGLFNLAHQLKFKFFFNGFIQHENEILNFFKFKYLIGKK